MKINQIQNSAFGADTKKVSFGKTLKEHNSWGARINPDTNEISFKVFTYPDSKKVSALIYDSNGGFKTCIDLQNKGNGVFEKTNISSKTAKAGDKYQYEIHKGNGDIDAVKDPYTFKQDELTGLSTIYDHSEFEWQNDEVWKSNPNRITRTSNGKDGNQNVRSLSIFELSPDTITSKRSYEGVISKLKEIKKLGFNAIEVMHVENMFSYNWGYDGVDKMAASSYLGGPDGLKTLVDEAHKEGLNVIFDIIPNHHGPDGSELQKTGPYLKGPNAFGDAYNFEGENKEYVRDYIANAAMNWVENYHVDGLRLDMTKYMESDSTIKQIAAELNYHHPDCFIIAEDGRDHVSVDNNGNYWGNQDEIHDKRVTSPLWDEEYGRYKDENTHSNAIKSIIENGGNLSRLGMDSEWDFAFYHKLDEAAFGGGTEDLINATLCSQDNVKYIGSHDEYGNFEGTRKIPKLMVQRLMLNDNIILNPQDTQRAQEYAKLKNKSLEESMQIVIFQKAQLVSEALATMYQTGALEKYKTTPEMPPSTANELKEKLYKEVLFPLGISANGRYSYNKIANAFDRAASTYKNIMTYTYLTPGPKMVFQGDESADLTPFRFFRQFESIKNEDYLYIEKGYKPAKSALNESTMGKIKYSKEGKSRTVQMKALMKDLNELNAQNPALTRGYIDTNTIVNHPLSKVIGLNVKDYEGDNELFTVSNFGDINYREDKGNEYRITFPKGRWMQVLNTDDIKYSGSGRHNNDEIIYSDGSSNVPINIAANSSVCFKKI